jgi:hypothetical protein
VNLFLGAGSVEKLRIAQGPVKPLADAAAARPRKATPPPLPAAAEAELKAAIGEAPDALKGPLERLGRAVLGKGDERSR